MTLENQVCSLPLAQRLEQLGVKQKSAFYWAQNSSQGDWNVLYQEFVPECPTVSAFTVAELGEMLPVRYVTERGAFHLHLGSHIGTIKPWETPNWRHNWGCSYTSDPTDERPHALTHHQYADTEADARAKMLIYLLENKLIQTRQAA